MKDMKYFGVALGILILAIVAIVVIGSSFGGSSKKKTTTTSSKAVKLLDYDNQDAMLSVTIQGPLVGDTKRRAVRMTITPEDRGIEILDGYDQTVERSIHYKNTESGYQNFLRAINNVGFTNKRTSTLADERGICPGGNNYIYDLYDARGQQVSHTWGSSCAVTLGTFAGSGPAVRQLFAAQIDDYTKFTAGVVPVPPAPSK